MRAEDAEGRGLRCIMSGFNGIAFAFALVQDAYDDRILSLGRIGCLESVSLMTAFEAWVSALYKAV